MYIDEFLSLTSIKDENFFPDATYNRPTEDIDDGIASFLKDFINTEKSLSAEDFNEFLSILEDVEENTQKIILLHIMTAAAKILESIQADVISKRTSLIESIKAGKYSEDFFETTETNHIAEYQRLIIIYKLLSIQKFQSLIGNFISKFSPFNKDGYLNRPIYIAIGKNIPLALNVLNLMGKLKLPDFSGFELDTQKPFNDFFDLARPEIQSGNGIKDITKIYKLGVVIKHSDEKPDITFISTDKKKILFIRHPVGYATHENNPDGVFMSKIARRIDPKTFSSERIFTNQDIGTRLLPGYVHPLSDPLHTKDSLQRDLLKEDRIIALPGMAKTDELRAFSTNIDNNTENNAISNDDLNKAYFVQIDFDRCSLNFIPEFEKKYEERLQSSGYYKKYFNKNDTYTKELIETRLHLSLFTLNLLKIDAGKCYLTPNKSTGAAILAMNRINIILNKFLCCKETLEQISRYNIDLPEIYQNVTNYFIKHDAKHLSNERILFILNELKDRACHVIDTLSKHDVKFAQIKQKIFEKHKTIIESINKTPEVSQAIDDKILITSDLNNDDEINLFSNERLKSRGISKRKQFLEDEDKNFLLLKFTWHTPLTVDNKREIKNLLDNDLTEADSPFAITYQFQTDDKESFFNQPNVLCITFCSDESAAINTKNVNNLAAKLLSYGIIAQDQVSAINAYFNENLTKVSPETLDASMRRN